MENLQNNRFPHSTQQPLFNSSRSCSKIIKSGKNRQGWRWSWNWYFFNDLGIISHLLSTICNWSLEIMEFIRGLLHSPLYNVNILKLHMWTHKSFVCAKGRSIISPLIHSVLGKEGQGNMSYSLLDKIPYLHVLHFQEAPFM